MAFLYFLVAIFGVYVLYWTVRAIIRAVKYPKLEQELNKTRREFYDLDKKAKNYEEYVSEQNKLFGHYKNMDVKEMSIMYADMVSLHYDLTSRFFGGKHVEILVQAEKGIEKRNVRRWRDAPKTSDIIREFRTETHGYLTQLKCMMYKYEALLSAFPDIEKYVDGIENIKALNNFTETEKQSKFYLLKNTIERERQNLLHLKNELSQEIEGEKRKFLQFEKEKRSELLCLENELAKEKEDIRQIIVDAELGDTKYLQNLIADYYSLKDEWLVDGFLRKPNPIKIKTADELKAKINGELREHRLINKKFIYFYDYAIEVYPELKEFSPYELLVEEKEIEEIYQNISEQEYYRLSDEEYAKVEPAEKNQKRLDAYWTRKKSKWTIGKDYERYIGYLYEQKGYKVRYQGIVDGYYDRGIDLVCKKNFEIILIQCKRWAGFKNINENVVCQLYGTGIKYMLDNKLYNKKEQNLFTPETEIKMMFYVTSDNLTPTAKEFAQKLGIEIIVKQMDRYPIIKCNINNENRIYHLPFDQQYDKTKIEKQGEFYAMTVKEAEDKGFRRAYRWFGNLNNN